MQNVLVAIGFGAAKAQVKLDQDKASPGDTVTGTVHIEGGQIPQTVDRVVLSLQSDYFAYSLWTRSYQPHDYALIEQQLYSGLQLAAHQKLQKRFCIPIPWETPVTFDDTGTGVSATLHIHHARNRHKAEQLHIDPTNGMRTVWHALEQQGFHLASANRSNGCNKYYKTKRYAPLERSVPFIRTYSFLPNSHENKVSSLRVVIRPNPEGVLCWVAPSWQRSWGNLFPDSKRGFSQLYFDQATLDRGLDAVVDKWQHALEARFRQKK